MKASTSSEKELVEQVARYLQTKHRDVIYRFDLAADLKLTPGQSARHKRLHPRRGYPDLFIASQQWNDLPFSGLFIELKREGTKLKKRDGSWASPHIAEQAAVLEDLAQAGYIAQFSCGHDETIQLIESYLGGPV